MHTEHILLQEDVIEYLNSLYVAIGSTCRGAILVTGIVYEFRIQHLSVIFSSAFQSRSSSCRSKL
ncbi:MAG: hypothetical protein Q4D14_04690 [Bacteroidales bacterium]|nr:hypothetical protein [Bacteroidales bacterium]